MKKAYTQYVIPILSVWWPLLSIREMLEDGGNEIYFISQKVKMGIMLCSQFCYLSMVTLLYRAYGFLFYQNCRGLLPQIGGEYVRILVQCQFFFE